MIFEELMTLKEFRQYLIEYKKDSRDYSLMPHIRYLVKTNYDRFWGYHLDEFRDLSKLSIDGDVLYFYVPTAGYDMYLHAHKFVFFYKHKQKIQVMRFLEDEGEKIEKLSINMHALLDQDGLKFDEKIRLALL